jgi:exodeoxyribonuclease VII small subunit
MPNKKSEDAAKIGYEAAVSELEDILEELEGDDIDVDKLADRVKRASDLVRACRDRIAAAKLHVEQVVAEVDDE